MSGGQPTAEILTDPGLTTLDLVRPVALIDGATLQFLTDDDQPHAYPRTLTDTPVSGSFFVATHATDDLLGHGTRRQLRALGPYPCRPLRARFSAFFDGLAVVDPGVTIVSRWRLWPGASRAQPEEVCAYGAVARIPASRHSGDRRQSRRSCRSCRSCR